MEEKPKPKPKQNAQPNTLQSQKPSKHFKAKVISHFNPSSKPKTYIKG